MRLQLSTWPEIETFLAKSKAILNPIGSDPSQASVEAGARIVGASVKAVISEFR